MRRKFCVTPERRSATPSGSPAAARTAPVQATGDTHSAAGDNVGREVHCHHRNTP